MNPDGTITWRELLAEATAQLTSAGIENPAGDAAWIVAEAMGLPTAASATQLDESATERGVASFDSMVGRRVLGEPLQYVLGSWAFRTLDLMVDSRVLIPRAETEMVVEFALDELDAIGGQSRTTTVVDLGTGSGAMGLSVAAERVRSRVWLTDASHDALQVATANIAGLGRAGARVTTAHGSWFDALPSDLLGSVDLVMANPPYISDAQPLPPDVEGWEPGMALRSGPDGLEHLRLIIDGAGRWLVGTGVLVCEISPEQAVAVAEMARLGFADVEVRRDLAGRDRALIARRPLS